MPIIGAHPKKYSGSLPYYVFLVPCVCNDTGRQKALYPSIQDTRQIQICEAKISGVERQNHYFNYHRLVASICEEK